MTIEAELLELINLVSSSEITSLADPQIFEPLMSLLFSSYLHDHWRVDNDYRSMLIRRFIDFGVSAENPLLSYLEHERHHLEHSRVPSQVLAIQELVKSGSKTAQSGLLEFVRGQHHSILREEIIKAFVQSKDLESISSLIEILLSNPSPDTRKKVAFAFGSLNNPETELALILALQDSHLEVVNFAIASLGKIKSMNALPYLIEASSDFRQPREIYVSIAQSAIEAIHAYQTDETLKIVFDWCIANLKHIEPEIRCFATHKLGTLGDNTAIKYLIEALDDDGVYERGYRLNRTLVSDAAEEALITIGTPEALAALEAWRQNQA